MLDESERWNVSRRLLGHWYQVPWVSVWQRSFTKMNPSPAMGSWQNPKQASFKSRCQLPVGGSLSIAEKSSTTFLGGSVPLTKARTRDLPTMSTTRGQVCDNLSPRSFLWCAPQIPLSLFTGKVGSGLCRDATMPRDNLRGLSSRCLAAREGLLSRRTLTGGSYRTKDPHALKIPAPPGRNLP
jgi:hypothetical protein